MNASALPPTTTLATVDPKSQVVEPTWSLPQPGFPWNPYYQFPFTYPQAIPDDEHGCQSQHISNSNSASIKHLSLLPSPTASSQPTLPRSIHHSSSMATPNIELTQLPSWFSRYSIDSPPPFAHLLIQSSDPVLKMTHVIGDKVQFETNPAPCIFLVTKWTGLVDDNEARREYYEAEFGVPGILPSTTQPSITFHLQLQNQIQRDRIRLPYFIMGMVPG